jgi:hypothetical protein
MQLTTSSACLSVRDVNQADYNKYCINCKPVANVTGRRGMDRSTRALAASMVPSHEVCADGIERENGIHDAEAVHGKASGRLKPHPTWWTSHARLMSRYHQPNTIPPRQIIALLDTSFMRCTADAQKTQLKGNASCNYYDVTNVQICNNQY